MPLTKFPRGIFATPNLGATGRGLDDSSTVYFVDKKTGSDSNTGLEPSTAFITIEKALTVAGAYDVVYVMDPGTTASDPNTYAGASANYTIPVASKGLALVGISSGGLVGHGRPMGPSIYEYAAATPIITVNAPMVVIENFRIAGAWDQGGTAVAGIAVTDFVEGSAEGYGLSVHNCYFEDIAASTGRGAIDLVGQWNSTVTNCTFMNCRVGIAIVSSGSTNVGTIVDTVKFFTRDGLGTKVKADIYIYCQGGSGILINEVYIGHDVPAASGAAGAICAAGGAEDGMVSNVYGYDPDGTVHATTGTIMRAPTTLARNKIYRGDGTLIVTT